MPSKTTAPVKKPKKDIASDVLRAVPNLSKASKKTTDTKTLIDIDTEICKLDKQEKHPVKKIKRRLELLQEKLCSNQADGIVLLNTYLKIKQESELAQRMLESITKSSNVENVKLLVPFVDTPTYQTFLNASGSDSEEILPFLFKAYPYHAKILSILDYNQFWYKKNDDFIQFRENLKYIVEKDSFESMYSFVVCGITDLIYQAYDKRNTSNLRFLLDQGILADVTKESRDPLLVCAANDGELDIVRQLIEQYHADVNFDNLAHCQAMKNIQEAKTKKPTFNTNSPIFRQPHKFPKLNRMAQTKQKLFQIDSMQIENSFKKAHNCQRPIMAACRNRHNEVIKYLLLQDDIDLAIKHNGKNLLFTYCFSKFKMVDKPPLDSEVICSFIARGFDILNEKHTLGKSSFSIMEMAMELEDEPMVEMLTNCLKIAVIQKYIDISPLTGSVLLSV